MRPSKLWRQVSPRKPPNLGFWAWNWPPIFRKPVKLNFTPLKIVAGLPPAPFFQTPNFYSRGVVIPPNRSRVKNPKKSRTKLVDPLFYFQRKTLIKKVRYLVIFHVGTPGFNTEFHFLRFRDDRTAYKLKWENFINLWFLERFVWWLSMRRRGTEEC